MPSVLVEELLRVHEGAVRATADQVYLRPHYVAFVLMGVSVAFGPIPSCRTLSISARNYTMKCTKRSAGCWRYCEQSTSLLGDAQSKLYIHATIASTPNNRGCYWALVSKISFPGGYFVQ
jgi:hypothetical protein